MDEVTQLPSGVISVRVNGRQTGQSIELLRKDARALIEKLEAAGKPVRVILDLRGITGADIAARKGAAEAYKSMRIDHIAIVTDNVLYRTASRLVMRASGMLERARYFKDEAAALGWLEGQL